MTAVSGSRWKIISYHLGRLNGYLILGGLAGFFGKELFSSPLFKDTVPWVATLTVSFGLVFLGVQLWSGKKPHFQIMPKSVVTALYRRAGGQPAAVGFLSAFLPCGWLHTYVIGALATQSALYGAGFLFAFWLGTLPAMSFAPAFVRTVLNPLAQKAPRFSAILLMSAGFFTIGSKMVHQWPASPHSHDTAAAPVGEPETHHEHSCH
jgi:sulfite exporter TauE/SafE